MAVPADETFHYAASPTIDLEAFFASKAGKAHLVAANTAALKKFFAERDKADKGASLPEKAGATPSRSRGGATSAAAIASPATSTTHGDKESQDAAMLEVKHGEQSSLCAGSVTRSCFLALKYTELGNRADVVPANVSFCTVCRCGSGRSQQGRKHLS